MRYDAVAFLESLFRLNPPARPDPPDDRADRRSERAAIMEFDGGLSRDRAEHFARLDVERQQQRHARVMNVTSDPG